MLTTPKYFSLPIPLFMMPLFVFFVAKTLFGPLLYSRRVRCAPAEVAGAALAGMGLSHAIARGVFAGAALRGAVFEITRKGAGGAACAAPGSGYGAVREEALLLAGLATCIAGVALTRVPGQIESAMWMSILALQALPYVAALACTALSRMPERSAAASAAGEREALPAGAG